MAGNHAEAVRMAEAGYTLLRTSSSAMQGFALYYLGEALLAAGQDLERALECLDRSIELCRVNALHFWVGTALVAKASLRARHGDPLEALPMFSDIIDRWRRAGEWSRQWVTLRNLTELFGRIGADDAATTLDAAAESSPTAEPSIGPQGDRLAQLRRKLHERMGAEAFAAACERGGMMSDEEAVAYAKTEIDRVLASDWTDTKPLGD
jgi:tetratricopeptide (TPR) repeat protein